MSAHQLAEFLYRGGRPQPLPVQVPRPLGGEEVFAHIGVGQQLFVAGGDGVWIKRTGIPLTPFGAVARMGMAAGNSYRKNKAKREAREQWRDVDGGGLYITNQRLVMQLSRQWEVVDYQMMMGVHFDGDGLIIETAGQQSMKLRMDSPDYYYVLLYYLAFGQVMSPPRLG